MGTCCRMPRRDRPLLQRAESTSFNTNTSSIWNSLRSSASRLSLSERSVFPRRSLSKTLRESASELSDIICSLYGEDTFIPSEVCQEIVLFTLTLVPGIYNFEGLMTVGQSGGSGCSCRLILDDDSCIVGGTFQEVYGGSYSSSSSFEYEVTNGTYDMIGGGIEFTKWYFPFNYQYKAMGQITVEESDEVDEKGETEKQIKFLGRWQRVPPIRGGRLDMRLTNQTVLEHAIKPGKYTFFGLSSWRKKGGLRPNVHTKVLFFGENGVPKTHKIEVEFKEHGAVRGNIHFFVQSRHELARGDIPDNKLADESYQIIDGEWHHFGKIVLVYENGKECYGFFNGSFYIGEWHPNTVQYLTMKLQNGMKLQRSSSVLSAYSECSNLSDDELIDGQVAANKMRDYYEQRAKNRIGHFEFTMISMENEKEHNGKVAKRKRSRLMQMGRGGVICVSMKDDADDTKEDEGEEKLAMNDVVAEEMRITRHYSQSLDSDDEDNEQHDGSRPLPIESVL